MRFYKWCGLILFVLFPTLATAQSAKIIAGPSAFLNAKTELLDMTGRGTQYGREYPMVFELSRAVARPFFVTMGDYVPIVIGTSAQSFYRGVKMTVEVKAVSDSKVYFTVDIEHGLVDEKKLASGSNLQQADVQTDRLSGDFDSVIGMPKMISVDDAGKSKYVLTIRFIKAD